tara:strand:+ start:658 stop:1023 length:366 start_codon:yes stop_codon:yes gene_type:complete
MNERDFEKQGEEVHIRIQEELFKKDKHMQKQFYKQFTTIPAEFREKMMIIEAMNLGYKIQDGYPISVATGEPATESQMNTINKATDRAMLRSNPHLEKFNMKYQDGFFIPINYKKLLEKEG